jgi:hypothetical protein
MSNSQNLQPENNLSNKQIKPVEIGTDMLCMCRCFDPCPLGKRGSEYRCTMEELVSNGIAVKKYSSQR